jgi:uncharacterized Fe-S cluster protein YjdI
MAASDAGPGSPSAGPWPGKAHRGSEITVYFDPKRCRHFAECLRGLPEVFNARQRPWIAPDAASAALVAEVIRRCPSGALHYQAPGIPGEQPDVPATIPPSSAALSSPRRFADTGTDSRVTDTRAARRCTRSARQPFCDAACDVPEPPSVPVARKTRHRDPPGLSPLPRFAGYSIIAWSVPPSIDRKARRAGRSSGLAGRRTPNPSGCDDQDCPPIRPAEPLDSTQTGLPPLRSMPVIAALQPVLNRLSGRFRRVPDRLSLAGAWSVACAARLPRWGVSGSRRGGPRR